MRFASVLLALSLVACGDPRDPGGPTPGGSTADLTEADAALARCDLRAAHGLYDAAYRAHPGDPDAALGFALTDMALVGEDPAAAAGLSSFGFTGGIDSEDMLWGPSALLDVAVRHGTWRSYSDHVEATFPFPPVRDRTNGWDAVSRTTLAREVVERGWALQPRFARLSDAFALAAASAPRTVRIDGVCGVGEVEMQATELYLLAATWRAMVMGLQITRGYDWDFPMRDVLDTRGETFEAAQRRAELLNTHLGGLRDAGAMSAVRDEWRATFTLFERAFEAGDTAGAPGASSLTEWRAFRAGLFGSLLEQDAAALELADGSTTAPGLTPTFTGDMRRIYAGELSLPDFGRTFTAHEDPMWGDVWVEVHEAPIDAVLASVLNVSPFDDTLTDVSWTHTDAWSGGETEWQIVEIESTRGLRPVRMPRFISPVMERYRDRWYFE